jgi:hypothetical protein
MSWKFSVSRSPLYSFFDGSTTACFGFGRTLEHVLAVGLVGELLVIAGGGDDEARVRRASTSRRTS